MATKKSPMKTCPRCHGKMASERNVEYGYDYYLCVNCGFEKSIETQNIRQPIDNYFDTLPMVKPKYSISLEAYERKLDGETNEQISKHMKIPLDKVNSSINRGKEIYEKEQKKELSLVFV